MKALANIFTPSTSNVFFIIGVAGIVGFLLGFIIKSAILAKHKNRVTKLENEMLANHSRILELEKHASELKQEDIAAQWKYTGEKRRGGQQQYSDTAIELCLTIRKVYHLPLRQTQGFMKSFVEQAGLDLAIPDYTTLSKRSTGLSVNLNTTGNGLITDIVVDSTGLKVYGEGEWKVRKHGAGKHRTWMKLHVAADEASQQIQAVTLTTNAVDDATEVKALLEQIEPSINSFKGDGAYDKRKVREQLYQRHIKQVIPPQHNAVISKKRLAYLKQREEAIQTIAITGRDEWEKQNSYHQRSKAETVMFRYKTIIGNNLSARKTANQQTEARIGCKILNITLQTVKPISVKIA